MKPAITFIYIYTLYILVDLVEKWSVTDKKFYLTETYCIIYYIYIYYIILYIYILYIYNIDMYILYNYDYKYNYA